MPSLGYLSCGKVMNDSKPQTLCFLGFWRHVIFDVSTVSMHCTNCSPRTLQRIKCLQGYPIWSLWQSVKFFATQRANTFLEIQLSWTDLSPLPSDMTCQALGWRQSSSMRLSYRTRESICTKHTVIRSGQAWTIVSLLVANIYLYRK
jgi:hypothetical protein